LSGEKKGWKKKTAMGGTGAALEINLRIQGAEAKVGLGPRKR